MTSLDSAQQQLRHTAARAKSRRLRTPRTPRACMGYHGPWPSNCTPYIYPDIVFSYRMAYGSGSTAEPFLCMAKAASIDRDSSTTAEPICCRKSGVWLVLFSLARVCSVICLCLHNNIIAGPFVPLFIYRLGFPFTAADTCCVVVVHVLSISNCFLRFLLITASVRWSLE
jgi:hypothetical protein